MSTPTPTLSSADQEVVKTLRSGGLTVGQLVDELGVTANAVRQRLVRLMAAGLIERRVREETGRGRPSHEYHLTDQGKRTAGDNFSDLARALWQEIQDIDDAEIRQRLLAGAVHRMLSTYTSEVTGETPAERLESVSRFFADRNIPITVEQNSGSTVLKVLECPYPDLNDESHQFCEVEKQLFSQALGSPVQLCQCRKNGDGCCSFEQVSDS